MPTGGLNARGLVDVAAYDATVLIAAGCSPTDAFGRSLSTVSAEVGDAILFVNTSHQTVTLVFPIELFGETTVELSSGEGATLGVMLNAEGSYFYTIEGCKGGGAINGNPDVKIGGGEEGGG